MILSDTVSKKTHIFLKKKKIYHVYPCIMLRNTIFMILSCRWLIDAKYSANGELDWRKVGNVDKFLLDADWLGKVSLGAIPALQ
jgi:hypothetical protein